MKLFIVVIAFLLFTSCSHAQTNDAAYKAVDSVVLQMPGATSRTTDGIAKYITTNFKTEDERVRAIFVWVAATLDYDVELALNPDFSKTMAATIATTLKTRKGVCQNFAGVFNEVCRKMGIRSYLVAGYTKKRGVISPMAHAWCAANVDDQWRMYDPTWAGGYVLNKVYVKKYNDEYYKVEPSVMINYHMPFDPLWEFLIDPITSEEFTTGKIDSSMAIPYFNYTDSLDVWDHMEQGEQLAAEERRIIANGVTNEMTADWLKQVRLRLEAVHKIAEVKQNNENVYAYNLAINDYNTAVKFYNVYIAYLNRQFMPLKPDAQIKGMIDSANNRINDALIRMASASTSATVTEEMIARVTKSMQGISNKIADEEQFVTTYLTKNVADRKRMFLER